MHLSFCTFVSPLGGYRLAPKPYLYKYLENGKDFLNSCNKKCKKSQDLSSDIKLKGLAL